ncbi:hypothetical protein ACGF12_29180 [Kitasatospora sp. NPDC048296]|uniref:hypothetical protein n=1 Tax=Kitasatospora sp. NPDC048296 TaxID=3364048 RepID=UPI00371B3E64
MVKSLLGRIGRRGATAVATVALAAGGVGLSAGEASAYGWVTISGPIPIGQGVGVYAQPTTMSPKVTGDLHSGDLVDVVCWTRGQDINNGGNVWYRVDAVHSAYYGDWHGVGYVYGSYVDGGLLWHQGAVPPC